MDQLSLKIEALDFWSPTLMAEDGPFSLNYVGPGNPLPCGDDAIDGGGGSLVAGIPAGVDEESFSLSPGASTPRPSPGPLWTGADWSLRRFFVWRLDWLFTQGRQPGNIIIEQKCYPPGPASQDYKSTLRIDPGDNLECTIIEPVMCDGPEGMLSARGEYVLSVSMSGPEIGGLAPFMAYKSIKFVVGNR
ncbi:MAG TPA: hypothetical protein VHY56_14175 [Candidatus Binataceae bacterium]|nr:hypothetical protein [Candidatus Binataceae bacterium]